MDRMLPLWSIQSSVLAYRQLMRLGSDIDRIMMLNSLPPEKAEQDIANIFLYNDTVEPV